MNYFEGIGTFTLSIFVLLTFLISFLVFSLLIFSPQMGSTIKKIFYVPSPKSTTNAQLLGGLGLWASTVFIISLTLLLRDFNFFYYSFERTIIKAWLLSSLVIAMYGYIDDRFEISARTKLFFQFTSVFILAFVLAPSLYPSNSMIAFIFLMFWGVGVVNGSNLLDGLDTLTIKLSLVTYSFYAYFSWISNSQTGVFISFLFMAPMLSFYFFNKEPARVHLGEIGGSFIGLSYFLLSILNFKAINVYETESTSFLISAVPLSLPTTELGISFFRRLLSKKSPFKGDRLHFHHIILVKFQYGAARSSTIYAFTYAMCLIPSVLSIHFIHPFISFVIQVLTLISMQLINSLRFWIEEKNKNVIYTDFTTQLLKKEVFFIPTNEIEKFEVSIINNKPKRSDDAA